MSAHLLDSEEYIEQAYFFRIYRERLQENVPAQEILGQIQEEILATTRLPMALEFLKGEITYKGRLSAGMGQLTHYFTPFQTFIISKAEEEKSRFVLHIGLEILEAEANYRAHTPTQAGLFLFQFESLARNRLGYEYGIESMLGDPMYSADWLKWMKAIRRQLGMVDFAQLIYARSQFAVEEDARRPGEHQRDLILFGVQEGRIAKANQGKDLLYFFAALQRQLGYPRVPRPVVKPSEPVFHPALEARLQRIEKQLKLLEQETSGKFDLKEFYQNQSDGKTVLPFPDDPLG